MAFPGLYNEVVHVSTEPTTVPTAAVLTHVLHTPTEVSIAVCTYLLYLLLYQVYLLYAHVLYLLLSSTYYGAADVRTYTYTRRFAPRAAYAVRYACSGRKNGVNRKGGHD